MKPDVTRIIKRLIGDKLQEIHATSLVEGDYFRLYEADKTPVKDEYGNGLFACKGKSTWDSKLCTWILNCKGMRK